MIQLVFRFRVRRGRTRPPRVYGGNDCCGLRGPPSLAHPLRVRVGWRRARERDSDRVREMEWLCVLFYILSLRVAEGPGKIR